MSKRRKKIKKKNRKIVWIIESLLFIILISLLVLLKIFKPQEREKIEEKSEETVKPLVIQTQQRKLDLDQLHSSAGIVIVASKLFIFSIARIHVIIFVNDAGNIFSSC